MDNYHKLPHFGGKLMSTQVSIILLRELMTGIFAQADKLPSEVELAERLGVSRTVIRDALSDMEREGFVDRVRGIGTVINRDVVNLRTRLDLKLEYTEMIRGMGAVPRTDSVRLRVEPADEETARLLDMGVGQKLVVCEKRILADDRPCIYSIDYLALELLSGVEYTDLDWSEPIFDLLDRYCGLTVLSETAHVRAVMGDDWVRSKLEVKPGSALLLLDEVGSCKFSRPVLRSLEYYTDFFDFTMLRKKF